VAKTDWDVGLALHGGEEPPAPVQEPPLRKLN
jgi:hypothetical protein